MSFALSFFLGLFSLFCLFIFSALCVFGVKYLLSPPQENNTLAEEQPTPPPKKPTVRKPYAPRKKRVENPAVIRSVEIDPNSIDRIYVKKVN